MTSRTNPKPVIDGPLPTCKGYQRISAATLAASTGLTVPNNTTLVLLQAEGGDLRWRADGNAPTATVGMRLQSGSEMLYAAGDTDIAALRFITSGGGILNATFYG